MIAMGYRQRQGDHALFIKHSLLGEEITLLVYVDDIIAIVNDDKEGQSLSQCLAKSLRSRH